MTETHPTGLFASDRLRPACRALSLLLALALALAGPAAARSSDAESTGAGTTAEGRVIVLGFDGADWRTAARMMGEGKLPNLAALAERGAAGPLVSTHPAESAAGWVAINTGANPVKNGVPSFVIRTATDKGIGIGRGDVSRSTKVIDRDGGTGTWAPAFLRSVPPLAVAGVLGLLAMLALRVVFRAGWGVAAVIGAGLGVAGYFAADRGVPDRPDRIPTYVSNPVKLDGFWKLASAGGAPALSLQAPMAFDRPAADGERTLFGLGVPDARGSFNGDWFVYTNSDDVAGRAPLGAEIGGSGTGTRFRIDFKPGADGKTEEFSSFLYGPIDYVEASELLRRFEKVNGILKDKGAFEELSDQRVVELSEERRLLVDELAERGLRGRDPNKIHNHRIALPLRVQRPVGGGDLTVTIAGESKTVPEGEWSDFYSLEFVMSPAYSVRAITRVRQAVSEPFELYVDTFQYDPRSPADFQPLSAPPGFAPGMAQAIGGPFETLGWGCMTNQLKDFAAPLPLFLEDIEFTLTLRRRLFSKALEDERWRLLYAVFSGIDRVQHLMMRFADPGHPMHDPEVAAQTIELFGETVTMAEVIELMYRQVDAIVGEAMAAADDEDLLLLCADHGFTSYRRGMHVNNWLIQEGLLTLKGPGRGGFGTLADVDWSKTKAYAVGLGMVYLNLEGREPKGIVTREEADELLDTIRARFLAARDGDTPVGSSAAVMKDLYRGPEPWGTQAYPCADLMLGFSEHYRVSWESVAGGIPGLTEEDGAVIPGALFADNLSPWSGDHASNDPELVTGIFFSSRPIAGDQGPYSVFHIAPTVLSYLGTPLPAYFDQAPLEIQR